MSTSTLIHEHCSAITRPSNSILLDAVLAVEETCDIQLGIKLDRSSGDPGDPAADWYGSSIRLPAENGAWNYGIVCDRHSCEELTRLLFAMEDDEAVPLGDMADALNEVINVAAGVFKRKRVAVQESLQIGLPSFMERVPEFDIQGKGLRAASCRLDGGSLDLYVVIYWQEGPSDEH